MDPMISLFKAKKRETGDAKEMDATKIEIDDYYPHETKQRWGGGSPVHPKMEDILAESYTNYQNLINEFVPYIRHLSKIPFDANPDSPEDPFWNNGFLSGMDAVVLYCLTAIMKPKLYIEVGSGNSTKFMSLAKRDHNINTRVVSIDPYPRAEIDKLCDVVIRQPLENCNLSIFDELNVGDFLFIDGSHRVLQNSDTTVFFLEVLPKIKPGVIIQIHDIMLPADYPESWTKRMYSEQYVLAAMLLFAHEKFNIIMPNSYVSWCTTLLKSLEPLWNTPGLENLQQHGGSFWFSKK